MKTRNYIRLTSIIACLIFALIEITQAADRSLDRYQFTILGLDIGKSTSQDIYSKLGPGIPFKSEAESEITQVCYV